MIVMTLGAQGPFAAETLPATGTVVTKIGNVNQTARAEGNANGGGGGSFLKVDGQWRLSDSFYDDVGEDHYFKELPKELRLYVLHARIIMESYGINGDNFWDNYVKGDRVIYTFVSEEEFKKVRCAKYLPPVKEEGEEHTQFGCTTGNTTYLIASLFKEASVLEQALAVIHERLWSLNPNPDQQRYIARLTSALGKLLKRRDDQQIRGDRTPLTAADLKVYDRLEKAAQQFGFETGVIRLLKDKDDGNFALKGPLSSQVWLNGGGLRPMSGEVVDENTFLGIGAHVHGGEKTVIRNSTLLQSTVWSATLADSTLTQIGVFVAELDHVTADGGRIMGVGDFDWKGFVSGERYPRYAPHIARLRYANIIDSIVHGTDILGTAEAPVSITKSVLVPLNLLGWIYEGVTIKNAVIKHGKWGPFGQFMFEIGKRAQLSDFTFIQPDLVHDNHHNLIIAPNTEAKNLNLKSKIKVGFLQDHFAPIRFGSEESPTSFDFGGKECFFRGYDLHVNVPSDLLQVCK
jgi:hypothetical protein